MTLWTTSKTPRSRSGSNHTLPLHQGLECPPRAIKFAAWQRVLQQPGNPQGTSCVQTVAHWPVTGCNLDGECPVVMGSNSGCEGMVVGLAVRQAQ